MKKIIKIMVSLFCLALTVSLFTGCNKNEIVEVGVVLPSGEQNRWLQDKAQFEEMLDGVGFTSEVLFSQASSATEKENVKTLVDKGIKVLIICSEDCILGADSIRYAKENGVKVISYDRLISDSEGVDYYITFNSLQVGELQAKYLIEKAGDTKGNNLYIYTGLPTDANSEVFFEGAWKELQPYIANGTFKLVNCEEGKKYIDKNDLTKEMKEKIVLQESTDWLYDTAYNRAKMEISQASKNEKGDVFVLAPNDDVSRGIRDAFSEDSDVNNIYITGQDAGLESVVYIIDGKQGMTVFKNTNTLAKNACKVAMNILKNEEVVTNAETNNGKLYVPTLETEVEKITIDNYVEKLIDSGYYSLSQINQFK